MTTITCKHSKIDFEAKTKKSKQHPLVSQFKNDAAKAGDYRQALEALDKATQNGNYQTIEEYIQLAEDIMNGKVDAKRQAEKARLEAEKKDKQARLEAKQKRESTNRYLREHGYTWSKVYADLDEYEEGEPSKWMLFSSDNRAVTVAQALDEIERGAETVQDELARKILQNQQLPYNVINAGKLEQAFNQKKEADKKAQEQQEQQEQQAWQQAKQQYINGMQQTSSFNTTGFTTVFQQHNRTIKTGLINNTKSAVIITTYSDGDVKQYYTSNHIKACLEKTTLNKDQKRFLEIFGN